VIDPVRYYVLDAAGEPVACADAVTWAQWFATAERHVAQDMDEGDGADAVRVSTVFLGLDHNWSGEGPPVLWETLVMGGPLDGTMRRYRSRADAFHGHQAVCRAVGEAMADPRPPNVPEGR
jgi:hypothetical protein